VFDAHVGENSLLVLAEVVGAVREFPLLGPLRRNHLRAASSGEADSRWRPRWRPRVFAFLLATSSSQPTACSPLPAMVPASWLQRRVASGKATQRAVSRVAMLRPVLGALTWGLGARCEEGTATASAVQPDEQSRKVMALEPYALSSIAFRCRRNRVLATSRRVAP